MIDLDDYKPLIDTTTLSDDELELWYGSKFAVKFLRMIEDCEIKVDFDEYPNDVFYFTNDICLIDYDLKNECFWIGINPIWSKLESEFGYNYQQIKDLTTSILKQHFKQKVNLTIIMEEDEIPYYS